MDYVSNPGTMNAIINFARRPTFAERVLKWRKASACEPGADPRACWCEPGKPGKCWLRSDDGRAGAAHPEGRGGFDRLRGGDPAGLFQHRLLRRAVLGQPPDRPARRRPAAAQLRADAVRHRPVPARLRLVPGDRGPARRSPRLLPDGAADRPLAGAGPRARPRSSRRCSMPSISPARWSAGAKCSRRTAPAAIRASRGPTRPSTSWRPTRTTRRSGSTGSAATKWCRPRRSAPTRRGRCTRTTWRGGSGPSMPRSTPMRGRPIRCGRR